jgi:molybdenum cofactor cytidylyltransferase
MQGSMTVWGIVLAAGAGKRVGGPKALLMLEGRSFLAHAAAALSRPGVAGVVAVLGYDAARVQKESGPLSGGIDVDSVVNDAHETGMLSSILCGLEHAAARHADAVLVHPVDHPRVAAATVDRVIAALQDGGRIVVPSYEGRRGHPAGFSRAVWPALRAASPDQGARQVLAEHPDWIVHVAGDAGSISGVNTPEEYERLSK